MYLHTCINSSFGRCIFAAKTYCNPIMERLDEILEIVREIREDIAYMKRHRNMLCGTPILEVSEVCEVLGLDRHQLEQCRKKRMIRARAVNGQMMYDAYELIALTEHFYRRKLRKTLSRIPQFAVR